VAFPIVDTSDASIEQVVMYVDMVHYGADYYADRLDITVRTGGSVTSLLGADYGREFGTAAISNGLITGADTGIEVGGSRASADLSSITVSSPVNEGLLVSGSSGIEFDNLQVDGGRYGVRLGSGATGKIVLTNVALDGQTQDGLVLAKDLTLSVSGAISNAAGAGLRVLDSSSGDWLFDGIALDSNGIGAQHDGSGNLRLVNIDLIGNTLDVQLSGSATMDFLEGTVDSSSVTATDNSKFTRLRELDVDITADSVGVADAPVKILDANNYVIDSGTTDSNGNVPGLEFRTYSVDKNGIDTANLAGYKMVTIATVAYSITGNSGNSWAGSDLDVRYTMDAISPALADTSGNSASTALTDSIDSRTCYSYVSASYSVHAPCTSLNYRA
jgi:hypothetical protein